MSEHGSTPVVVVGGGPAGLASAAMLERVGVRALVLERGPEIGAAWRTRYDRLTLHTVRWLSSLPGFRFPRTHGKWPSRDAVVDYLGAYAEHHGLRVQLGTEVERIERDDGGWRLLTAGEPIGARRVVIATGFNRAPLIPDWPGRERFAGELTHSGAYRNPEPYRGRDVLVVGPGNSGAEIAVDLLEGGARRVRLSVRTPPHIVKRDSLGLPSQVLGIAMSHLPPGAVDRLALTLRKLTIPDLSGHGLPLPPDPPYTHFRKRRMIPILDVGIVDAIRRGRIEVVPAVERLEGSDVVLAGGSRLAPDAVIAATGFTPALEPLVGDLGVLGERGEPILHVSQTHPAAPGLHFVGFTVTLGGTLRKVGLEARELARSIADGA